MKTALFICIKFKQETLVCWMIGPSLERRDQTLSSQHHDWCNDMKSRWLYDALELVCSSAEIFVAALHLPFNSELHLVTYLACSEIFSRTKIITGSAKCLSKFVCVRFEIARVMNQRRSAPFFAVSNVNTCEFSGSEQ